MRALVLSGGGGLGAYQVGALNHILGLLEVHYDIVVGVSVGAINGLGVAMHQRGDEVLAAEYLRDMWLALKTSDVVKPHFLQPLALGWQPSTHSFKPLRKLLTERVDMDRLRGSGKIYRAVGVDAVSGEFRLWSEQDDKDELIRGVLASAATPILHPPVVHGGELMYDGGIRDVTPARQAIALGADEIDIILTQSSNLGDWNPEPNRIWNTGLRVFEIMFRELVEGDLRAIELYNALAAAGLRPDKRVVRVRLLRPEEPLPMDTSKFEPDEIRAVMQIGQRDAERLGDWT